MLPDAAREVPTDAGLARVPLPTAREPALLRAALELLELSLFFTGFSGVIVLPEMSKLEDPA